MDCVISESCSKLKRTILQNNCRKITILRSFSYKSFVKFQGKKIASNYITVYIKICIKTIVMKGLHSLYEILRHLNASINGY